MRPKPIYHAGNITITPVPDSPPQQSPQDGAIAFGVLFVAIGLVAWACTSFPNVGRR